jgi:ferredoxin, 2Fe-2S
MVQLTIVDRSGKSGVFDAEPGRPLMFVLRDALGLPVEGLCGGCASCGTCHIYVDDAWLEKLPARQAIEMDLLDQLYHFKPDCSRLSCQIMLTPEMDGFKLTLAPGE